MMQKLAEISDGDHSGLGQESLHMAALIVMSRGIIFKQRGVGQGANIKQQQSAADNIVQHQYPQTPMMDFERVKQI